MIQRKRNLVPWWNHENNKTIILQKKCVDTFKKKKSLSDHIQQKKARTPFTYITKISKSE